ncbi:MAG TPA: amidohydrolase family protein [Gemmatimonadaceae bacterium]|nr:amidohydrolase family protein [Gemmatimonadaceae bacterium]
MHRRPLLTLVALATAPSIALAQNIPPSSSATAVRADYALTNVRIVTAPGRVIERGTVLTRDGRIAAVGANVTVPNGVVRIDLAGHTVFPGLIDAATSIGLPSPTRELPDAADAAAGAGRGGGGGGGGRGGAGQGGRGVPLGRGAAPPPPVVLPELDASAEAADMFAPTDDQLKAFRAGGVTTVGLVFRGGIFPGRVGAALTGMREGSRLPLRAAAGQEVSFGTKRGGYPSTLIGALAFVRQSYLDAQYEARIEKAFKAGTPGARSSNDPFRRALIPAATNEMPSWFIASSERSILRVNEIATELGIKSPVVVGAEEGYRAVSALKSAGATAIVSVNFPSADSTTGRTFLAIGNGRSGTAPPADSAAVREVRANAATLAKAGIPVAFSSYGGESGATFRDRIRLAIDAGMSADDALRAVTVTPAALLGVTAAVGTIEPGKLANLVVVTGNDLFASGTPIKHVFVEGRLY